MFQNLKAEELYVIITRKENSVTGSNTVHISVKKKVPQILQSDCPFGTRQKPNLLLLLLQSGAVNLVEMSNC